MFKLFLGDVGLLGCALDIPPLSLFAQDFGIAKGFFAENFVVQELRAMSVDHNEQLYSWSKGALEVEFVRHSGEGVVLIEVKSGHRTKAKSLSVFIETYKPEIAFKLYAGPLRFDANKKILNLPLYLVHWLYPWHTNQIR